MYTYVYVNTTTNNTHRDDNDSYERSLSTSLGGMGMEGEDAVRAPRR